MPDRERERRFIADAMLGRAARWLRVLGFDTMYDPALDDPELVSIASMERRALLSRDRRLIESSGLTDALLIRSQRPFEQLREIVQQYGIDLERELFTRCLICNEVLVEPPRETLESFMPEGARALEGPVRKCPACGRIYWPGSHTRRMRAVIGRVKSEG